uniref:Integrase catalytic domain-containing protein n=1 Tax=Tanacetum cinerariifolium TaxID=118510 RepID=A0A6L2NIZ4_TANCI|nr:hypothetical protein [Tanacetum cinerariifolium]
MLLMPLSNEHIMTFNQYKDAKTLFAAIEIRFGGNEATKKTQKTLLKQMYKNFSALSTESLDSIFHRSQNIVSQLAILGENISQKELNLKFLRSLPFEWNTHVVVWKNKPDLDTRSFDDLYNNYKIVKQKVKGTATLISNLGSQNMAFVSSPSNTNEVNTAYRVSTANTQASPVSTQFSTDTQVNTANLSDATVYAFLVSQSNESQIVHENLIQIHKDDLKEMDLKWQLALLSIRTRRSADNLGSKITGTGIKRSRRTVNVEENASNATVAVHGAGFNWSYMADDEVPTNMALMAFQTLRIEFNKSEFNLATYERGLASVEEKLVFYKKNEPEFEGYGPKTSNSVSEDILNEVKESPDASLVKELVLDDKLEKKTIFPTVTKIEFVRPKQQEKPVRKPGKYAEMPRVVNTAKPNSAVVNAIRANQINVVKASSCWVWRSTKLNSASITLKKHNYVDARGISESMMAWVPKGNQFPYFYVQGHPQKEDQGYVDSGCSRHMTGNISYLSDFKEFDGGYVTFGGGAKRGKITGKGTLKTVLRKNNMYSVDMKNIVPKESLTCLVTKATLDELMLWHRRLGHVNFKTINKLVKENLVRGLPTKHFENDQTCVACLKGKQHKASCKSKIQNSITQPLFMLHMDLFGHTSVSILMNKKYCLVVTDDYSRFTWVFFFATKDETSGILKRFITEIENLVDKKVKIIRCDNGTEFKNKAMSEFCEKKGIKKEYSVARNPQQNSVAERRNMTLIEAARTMVLVVKPYNKTPYELFRGRTPDLSLIIPFGCHVTILNTLDHLEKFDGKSEDGFFIGYSLNSKAFRVYNVRTRKGEENLHIRFLEDKPIIAGDGPTWLFDIDTLTKLMNYVPVVAGTNSINFVGTEKSIGAGHASKDDDGVTKESGINDQERPENSTQDVNTTGLSINTVSTNVNTGSLNINIVSLSVTTAPLEATHADLFGDEIEVDMSNITTTYLVSSTPDTRIHKDHSLDHVIGDVQSMYQMDVKSAFLYGKIEKEVYVCQPPGFEDPEFLDKVYKKDDGIFISQDKYVDEILKKFSFSTMKTASTPMETSKPLLKDENAKDDLPFDLEAYTNSDYAGASLDKKSIIEGCQFLESRLISWQCKKQTIVANSTTEAEYVVASNCYGHVLWIQNQMLDYGYNFMNTKIYIDNESTICIVKNLVFHSKTKHIEIRHHFIKDSNKKKLIQMIKIHTDKNVADLLTKAFDETATARTLDNGEIEITATIDGKVKIITKASVRRHIKLANSNGISSLPTIDIFEQLSLMRVKDQQSQLSPITHLPVLHQPHNHIFLPTLRILIKKETEVPQPSSPPHTNIADKAASTCVDVRHGGATTNVTSLDTGQGSSNIDQTPTMPHDSPFLRKVENLEKDLKQNNQIYGVAYTKLIKKVKKLEKTVKSSQARRMARIVVSDYEDDLKDSSKQERKIAAIVQDPTISLVQHDAEIQGRNGHDIEVDTVELVYTASTTVTTVSIIVSTASPTRVSTVDDITMAKTLVYIRKSATKDKAMRLQAEINEEEKQRISKVHETASSVNIEEWEDIRARVEADEELVQRLQTGKREKLSFDEIKDLFEITIRRVNTFIPMETEVRRAVPDSKKKKSGELSQEKLQHLMIIVPEERMNIEALQTKYPTLTGRDDLVKLWSLVQEIFNLTKPTEDKERQIWVELKRLFELDANDELWKSQKHIHHGNMTWRLYDTCGVHHVSTKDRVDIYMLVKREYPLLRGVLTLMLVVKLMVDQHSEMANELLQKIFMQAERPKR